MQKILVTGANSFTASHLIPFLASQGYEIQGLTRSTKESHSSPQLKTFLGFVSPYFIGDLSDPKFTENLTYKPDVIVHLAANNGSTNLGISKIFRDNVDAVANLISFSKRVGCPKIIALSSVSVHGQISSSVLSEATGFENPDIYGYTKRAAELLLQQCESDQSIFILRLPSILGYGAKNHWLSTVLASALSNSPITFQNSNAKFNNAVYIEDLLVFISLLISCNDQGIFSFPLASTQPITVGEIVELLVKTIGSVSKFDSNKVKRSSFIIDDLFARKKFGYTSRTTALAVETFAIDAFLKIESSNPF